MFVGPSGSLRLPRISRQGKPYLESWPEAGLSE